MWVVFVAGQLQKALSWQLKRAWKLQNFLGPLARQRRQCLVAKGPASKLRAPGSNGPFLESIIQSVEGRNSRETEYDFTYMCIGQKLKYMNIRASVSAVNDKGASSWWVAAAQQHNLRGRVSGTSARITRPVGAPGRPEASIARRMKSVSCRWVRPMSCLGPLKPVRWSLYLILYPNKRPKVNR